MITEPLSLQRTPVVPVTQSVIAPHYLISHVLPEYPIGKVRSCVLSSHSFSDLYQVETENGRFVLRVYRHGRAPNIEDLHFELELLRYIRDKGVGAAVPILRIDGAWLTLIDAPEGRRYAALFEQAKGVPFTQSDDHMRLYSRAVAEFHIATEDFSYRYHRPALTLHELIDKPLAQLAMLLRHRPDDHQFLQRIANRASRNLQVMSDQLETGICHNDLHGGNAVIDESGNVTFFDFDECRRSWRAYEVAVILWSEHRSLSSAARYPAFMEGYQTRRRLKPVDRRAVPYFVIARHFWWIGTQITHAGWFGSAALTDDFWTQAVEFLQTWENELK